MERLILKADRMPKGLQESGRMSSPTSNAKSSRPASDRAAKGHAPKPLVPWVSGENSWCLWSADGHSYRWYLIRQWDESRPQRACIGLNPSTANEVADDNTVNKLIRWADRDGFGSIAMLNLFALVATDPQEMLKSEHPSGTWCDYWIAYVCRWVDEILCCWGNHGTHRDRAAEVVGLLKPYEVKMRYLQARDGNARGMTKQGQPPHPLYLGNSTPVLNWLDGSAMQYPRSDNQ